MPAHEGEFGDAVPVFEAGVVAEPVVGWDGFEEAAEAEIGREVGLHVGAEGAVPVDDVVAAPVEGDWSLVDVLVDGLVEAAAVGRAFPAGGGGDEAEVGGDEVSAGLEDAGGFGDGGSEVGDIHPDDVADDGVDGG